MTREILGLAALNGLILALGGAFVWALRPQPGLGRLADAGIAYMLGLALVIVVGTIQIALGLRFSALAIVLGCVVAVGVTAAVVRGRAPGASRGPGSAGSSSSRVPSPLVLGVGLVALAAYLSVLFLATRLMPAHEWDGWWLWTLRAKAFLYEGDLESAGLTPGSAYASYPPGLSLLYATGLRSMGSVDAVTLHLQNWFMAVGFAAALAGVLLRLTRAWIAMPAVLLVVTLPALRDQAPLIHADALLAYELAIAALLLLAWMEIRAAWMCAAASIILGAALLTKRDALLFVGCVLVAALVATARQRGWAWRGLVAVSVATAAIGSVWWFAQPRVGATTPSGGAPAVANDPGRFVDALRLTVEAILDSSSSSMVLFLVALALPLAVAARATRLAAFTVVFVGLSVVGIAAAIATELRFDISRNPIASPVDRLVLAPLVVAGAVLPLLLEAAWRGRYAGAASRRVPALVAPGGWSFGHQPSSLPVMEPMSAARGVDPYLGVDRGRP